MGAGSKLALGSSSGQSPIIQTTKFFSYDVAVIHGTPRNNNQSVLQ
jgi:hypothetical protein